MKRTGIKVWVLTGDKIETAVNIGHSAGLLDEKMDKMEIQEVEKDELKETLKKYISNLGDQSNIHSKSKILRAIIVAGDSLVQIDSDVNLR